MLVNRTNVNLFFFFLTSNELKSQSLTSSPGTGQGSHLHIRSAEGEHSLHFGHAEEALAGTAALLLRINCNVGKNFVT